MSKLVGSIPDVSGLLQDVVIMLINKKPMIPLKENKELILNFL